MNTFNYANLRLNFNLQNNGKCLNNKTLEQESCQLRNTNTKYKFEKVTLGDNSYILVDYASQNCLQENNTMDKFTIGKCQVYNTLNSKFTLNGHTIKNPSFNSVKYNCKNTFESVAEFKPLTEAEKKATSTIPTLPKGYILPLNGNKLYKK